MNKEFVTYEQAVALKELGFDEPCISVYYFDKRLSEPMSTWVITNDNTNSKRKSDLISCSVPTFSQVFRWFREKYQGKIWINISHQISFNEFEVNIDFAKNGFVTTEFEKTFNSYEEAEQACLDKLIEIVKNGKTN